MVDNKINNYPKLVKNAINIHEIQFMIECFITRPYIYTLKVKTTRIREDS